MHLKKLLFKNTGIQIAAQIMGILVAFMTTFVLSRYLGVERFGGLNYIFAFYYFFLVFADLGLDVVSVRECSKSPEDTHRIIGSMRTLKLIIAIFLVVMAWLLTWQIPFPLGLKPGLYLYALILPLLALEVPAIAFQVNLNAKYPAMIGFFKSLANLLLLVILISMGLGMTGCVLALVLSEFLVMIVVNIFSRSFVKPIWALDWNLCTQIFKSSFSIALTGVFVAITNRADFLMLERMTDLHQVGLYSAAYKVTSLLEFLPLAMMSTLYPIMSRYAGRSDFERLQSIYKKCLLLFTAIALPLGVGVTLFARPIVQILFGGEFLDAAPCLQILIWATVFLYVALTGGNLLISLGREKINLVINIVAASMNIGLNFLWIPKYGLVGAAAATSIAFFTILILTLFAAQRGLRDFALLKKEENS